MYAVEMDTEIDGYNLDLDVGYVYMTFDINIQMYTYSDLQGVSFVPLL